MPSARMETTVCVASNSATPVQMAATDFQLTGRATMEPFSMIRIVVQEGAQRVEFAANQPPDAVCGLANFTPSPSFFTHAYENENRFHRRRRPAWSNRSSAKRSAVHFRRPADASRELSRMDLPQHRLRHELQPRHAHGTPHVR